MDRRKIYFGSDHHFDHFNSIRFDQRPFRDLDHMHTALINNHNSVVPKDGITYFVGDVGMGPGLAEYIKAMNGLKVLVAGNHDKGAEAMYKVGFDVVLYGAKLIIANEVVTVSHYPLLGVRREPTDHIKGHEHENWHGETKLGHLAFKDEGQFHIHAHIHSGIANPDKKRILGRQIDVGMPGNRYTPTSIGQIESWIMLTKNQESKK